MKKVLTIAGSDSSGGAGIQADLRTFAAFGVYGASAITAVTAQNTLEVKKIITLPASFVGLEIDAVMEDEDSKTYVWKTGMLATSDVVKTVARKAKQYKIQYLVVDPVLQAGTGRALLEKEAKQILMKKLFPLAFVATPNIGEAEALTGRRINSVLDMKDAAKAIHAMGAKNVVVKGGHLFSSRHPEFISGSHYKLKEMLKQVQHDSISIDILYDGKKFYEFSSPRIQTGNTHGTGCTFASAIAAEIVKGKSVVDAVKSAKEYVIGTLRFD